MIARAFRWSFLPPRVVAELELNSVNPPPDTFEEKQNKPRILKANNLNGKPIRATVNSKREISNA